MPLEPEITRREEAAKKAREIQPLTLEPPFPYSRLEFDPFFFGADAEPIDEDAP